ncbi:MAG: hypothetical protein QNJ47_01970 [Nostocaceae cyanobacterium]|nr:hypothetical protein [Nostocaceae cyanobacterium]
MTDIKEWNQLQIINVRGLHTNDEECRLLEGYIVQHKNQNGFMKFSQVVDLLECKVEDVEFYKKNDPSEMLGGAIAGAIIGGMFAGKTGANIGSQWGLAQGAIAQEIRIKLVSPQGYSFLIVTDNQDEAEKILFIFNGSFKPSKSLSQINKIYQEKQQNIRNFGWGCLGFFIIGFVIVMIMSVVSGSTQTSGIRMYPIQETRDID